MKKLSYLIVILMISIVFIGCTKKLSGKYVDVNNSKSYIEFYTDGTWYCINPDGAAYSGKYTVDGNTLIMSNGLYAEKETIQGKKIICADGSVCVKK